MSKHHTYKKTSTYAGVVGGNTKVDEIRKLLDEACREIVDTDAKTKEAMSVAGQKAKDIHQEATARAKDIVSKAEQDAAKLAKDAQTAYDEKLAELTNREEVLDARLAKFEAIEHDLGKFKSRIKLNVGGSKFETTRTTLEQQAPEGMLAAMFSGRHVVDSDDEGYVFLDRDGTHFGAILNFMRTGKGKWPQSPDHASQLRDELDYYQLLDAFDAVALRQYTCGFCRKTWTSKTVHKDSFSGMVSCPHCGREIR